MLFQLKRFYIGLARQAPQTNEIRRSSVMISVSHYLVELYWLTRAVSELGVSAGLDLILDYYGMEVAAEYFGARDPFLTLTPDTKSHAPKFAIPEIERGSVDLNSLDPNEAGDFLSLMAYAWPDQLERMERLRRAAPEQKTKIYAAGAQE